MQEKYTELLAYAPALLDSANPKRVPEISRLVGDAYYRSDKFEEAIPYLEKHYTTTYNNSNTDKYQLGYAYYKSKQYDKAIPLFNSVSTDNSELAQTAHYHLADCYLKTDKKNFARNAFLAASKSSFDKKIEEDALFNYAVLSYELSYDPYNKSIDAFLSYIEKYPDSEKNDEAYQYLLNVYMTTKNYTSALASLEKMKSLDIKLKEAYQRIAFNSAVEHYHNNKINEAIQGFILSQKYPINKSLNAQTYYWMAEAYFIQKKYDIAIQSYQKFIFEPGAILEINFNTANYNIAYAYFNQKKYEDAITWFRKFASTKSETDTVKLTDANLRIGDAYFLAKDYFKAEGYYLTAYNLKGLDADYALYQRAMSLGILKKQSEKMEVLYSLIKDYPKSSYRVDAQFQLGQGYLQMSDYDKALINFNEIVENYPNSSYVKRSLNNIGLIYYNNKENEKALEIFKRVINEYPNYEDAKEALMAIKNIYVRLGRVDEYATLMNGLNFVNISEAQLDSVMYESAEMPYLDGNFKEAKIQFSKYLEKFEQGIFALNANYYKAECEMKENNFEEALKNYNKVVSAPTNKFTESSLVNLSRINFGNYQFVEALKNFKQLEQIAEYKSNQLEARVGLMKCYFFTEQYEAAIIYADIVIETEKLADNLLVESHITKARSYMKMNNFEKALEQFQKTADLTSGEYGAESKYNMGSIYFKLGQNEDAEKQIYELVNRVPSYAFWVAKGLILLSDLYFIQQDNFQAKATLQSIIDNYKGKDDLVDVAKYKLQIIIDAENVVNEKVEESNELKFDNKNSDLFDEDNEDENLIESEKNE
jgi:TolA-binding protein